MNNLISVIIPTKNRAEYLKQAINSILLQENVNIEIIVVDDGSTDDTEMVINRLKDNERIVYIKNDKSMFAHNARKKGYLHAKGEFIIFMDDDDYYMDNKFFADSLKVFLDYPSVGMVIGMVEEEVNGQIHTKNAQNELYGIKSTIEYLNGFGTKFKKPKSTLSAMFRSCNLEKNGLKDSSMVNDTCIYLYGILKMDVYIMNRSVAVYRIHNNNISKSKFHRDFIVNTLNTKKIICDIASMNNILEDRNKWYFEQIKSSAYYFLRSSKMDIRTVITIFIWLIRKGTGIRYLFFKDIIKRTINRSEG